MALSSLLLIMVPQMVNLSRQDQFHSTPILTTQRLVATKLPEVLKAVMETFYLPNTKVQTAEEVSNKCCSSSKI